MKENDALRPISNERPEFLVSEKSNQSAIACYSDGEMMLLKNDLGQSSHRWHYMS
jgi:hypothetical protein